MARQPLTRLPDLRLKIRVHGRHPWFYRKMIQKPEQPLPAGYPHDFVHLIAQHDPPGGMVAQQLGAGPIEWCGRRQGRRGHPRGR